jgi:pseudoazurin
MFRAALSLALIATTLSTQPVLAATTEVDMLNAKDGQNFVFSPDFVKIAVGDTITFKAVNPGHNVGFVTGDVPDGVPPLNSPMSKDVDVTYTVPGIYVMRCIPHYGLGMVAVVEVGDNKSNLDAVSASAYPPLAKARLTPIFDKIKSGQ